MQRAPSDPPFPGPGSRNVLCATHRLPGRCSACLGPWSRTAAQDCSRRLARSRAPSWIPHAGGHRCRGDWRRRFVILGTLPRNRSPAGYDPHSPVTSRQDIFEVIRSCTMARLRPGSLCFCFLFIIVVGMVSIFLSDVYHVTQVPVIRRHQHMRGAVSRARRRLPQPCHAHRANKTTP